MTEASEDDIRQLRFQFVQDLSQELSQGNLDLPSFPDIAMRVRKTLADPEASVPQIAKVVASEPVLSARILKLANSALLKRGASEVTDMRMALSRLGFDLVRNAAMSVALEQILKAKSLGDLRPQLETLWQHSIKTGAISYALARRQDNLNPDEAMLAGLLHDIGKYYILRKSKKFPGLFLDASEILESEMMDEWHTGVGRAILSEWNFSEAIAIAADEHDTLDREHNGHADLADVVLVANLLANVKKRPPDDTNDWNKIPAFKQLGMTAESSIEVIRESAKDIRSMSLALTGR